MLFEVSSEKRLFREVELDGHLLDAVLRIQQQSLGFRDDEHADPLRGGLP